MHIHKNRTHESLFYTISHVYVHTYVHMCTCQTYTCQRCDDGEIAGQHVQLHLVFVRMPFLPPLTHTIKPTHTPHTPQDNLYIKGTYVTCTKKTRVGLHLYSNILMYVYSVHYIHHFCTYVYIHIVSTYTFT